MNAYLYQYIIATPILVLMGVLVILFLLYIFKKDHKIAKHFKKYAMTYGLIVAIAALVGSLGFSEGYAFSPCKLCWIQRIFHYPHIILFLVAMKLKDKNVWLYSIWLSAIGFVIAMYQVLIQFVPNLSQATICSVIPAADNCSDILVQAYGFISIPVMSAVLFLALIVLYLYQKRS